MTFSPVCTLEMDVILTLQKRCNVSLAMLLQSVHAGDPVGTDVILDLDEQLADLADMSRKIIETMKVLQGAR